MLNWKLKIKIMEAAVQIVMTVAVVVQRRK